MWARARPARAPAHRFRSAAHMSVVNIPSTTPDLTSTTPDPTRRVTPNEVARLLGISTGALAMQRKRGVGLPFVKEGRQVFYPYEGVAPYIRASPTGTQPSLEALMTTSELARLLCMTESALGHLRHRGEGPIWINIGRSIRYSRGDVDAWIQHQRNKTLDFMRTR